jgi:hypothetical protein
MLIAVFVLGIALGRFHPRADYRKLEERADTAFAAARRFERDARELRRKARLRDTRERLNTEALREFAAEIERRNLQILEREKELAFYRRVLGERGGGGAAAAVRSFEINPDFRPNFYRANAALARGGSRRKNFVGSFELLVNVRAKNGKESELRLPPDGDENALDFRLYYEIDLGFSIPPGAEITNARLIIRDAKGAIADSRALVEEEPAGPDAPPDEPADIIEASGS